MILFLLYTERQNTELRIYDWKKINKLLRYLLNELTRVLNELFLLLYWNRDHKLNILVVDDWLSEEDVTRIR